MKPESTKLIEQYLQNELSAQDRAAFIRELNNNADLLREVALQQSVHEGARRLAQRTLVQKTAKRYHLQKTLVTTAVVVVVATAIALTTWLATRSFEKQSEQPDAVEMAQLIEKIDDKLPLDGAPAEYFNLTAKDTVVLSESGVLLSVPGDAFMSGRKIYDGPKVIQWQEAFDAATIVKCGLSTMSGDRLLETGGMFGMQAFTPEGKQLDINPKVGVYIQIPVAEHKEGMLLFEGKKGKNGLIDWQNPKPLEKLPVMADMSELDFYPPGYEAYLDELKWKTGKKDRDSLYLSFEDEDRVRNEQFTTGNQQQEGRAVETRVVADYLTPDWESITIRDGDTSVLPGITGLTYFSDGEDYVTWECSVEKTDASHGFIVAKATIKEGEHISSARLPEGSFGYPTKMDVLPTADFVLNGPLQDVGEPQLLVSEGETISVFEKSAEFRQAFTATTGKPFEISFSLSFQVCNESRCLAPADVWCSVNASGFKSEKTGHIPPSKVLAFWKKEFNNTLLATRDFERRMAAIHGTCSEEVLDLYTDNLNKPLHEIDAMVAKRGHAQFNAFAGERIGAVKLDNPHMNNMRRFYAHATAMLRKEAKKDGNFVRRQEAQWDAELRTVRRKSTRDDGKRNQAAAAEQRQFDRESIARQFAANTVAVTILRNAPANVYNCDAYRGSAPVAVVRTEQTKPGTTEYTREKTRRISPTQVSITTQRATIVYNDFALEVADAGQYGKLMLYLFPHELNSYLRIDAVKGKFSKQLNDGMLYDIAVVAITENDYFIWEKRGLNKGDLGTVELETVSEAAFGNRIEALNRNRGEKTRAVSLDLEWLSKEKQHYAVRRLQQENREFRTKLLPKVFPCVVEGMAVPASDSISGTASFHPIVRP